MLLIHKAFKHSQLVMIRLIKDIIIFGLSILHNIIEYCTSFISGCTNYKRFRDVNIYCMFIGYARSGHSIIGTLLDAHPNAVIAHELNVLRYVKKGFNKRQIFSLLIKKSNIQSMTGRRFADKNYKVPNQWQGKYSKLLVIGDKKGGGSSKLLKLHPDLIEKLENKIKLKIKIIHVIRNPYDNITTIARRRKNFQQLTWEELK
ncbi:MAG: hypothetical protein FK732_03270, partial [Asgard group archaeon]|nr:hypothetical protein [Asgard group archaeon]